MATDHFSHPMISIHCTQCQQLLEMDDAFAGGVCRCQFCGTIQTVPRAAKNGSTKSKGSTKALYKKGVATQHPGAGGGGEPAAGTGTKSGSSAGVPSGLDELAEIVASSGLTRGSLSRPAPRRTTTTAAAGAEAPGGDAGAGGATRGAAGRLAAKKIFPMPLVAGGIAAAVLGVALFVAMRPSGSGDLTNKGNPTANNAAPAPAPPPQPPEPAGPSFAGVEIPAGTVAYLLDRSSANNDVLETLKAATYRSAASLGENRKFQIVFWHRTDEGVVAYPDAGLAAGTPEDAQAAKKRFEDVVAYGSTDLKPTIEIALQADPDVLVIVTAKVFQLGEGDVAVVKEALRGKQVKVHTIALGEADSPTLKQIAEDNGGEYRVVPYNKLRAN